MTEEGEGMQQARALLTCFFAPSTDTSPLKPAIFLPVFWIKLVMTALVLCFVLVTASVAPPSCSASRSSASSSAVTVAGVVSLIASLGVPARGGGLL